MSKLARRLGDARGEPIDWDGQTIHSIFELPLPPDAIALELRFEDRSPAREQALRMDVRGGQVEINGERLTDIVLWSDTTPPEVVVALHPTTPDRFSVRVWNAWRDPEGTMQAWIGNAAMIVDQPAEDVFVLRCSDGFDEPTFNDLVVRMLILRAAKAP